MKYTAQENSNGYYDLFMDGKQSICPKKQPIPMQTNMGGLSLMNLPCTNACPLCAMTESNWEIYCGNQTLIFELESVVEIKKPSSNQPTILMPK